MGLKLSPKFRVWFGSLERNPPTTKEKNLETFEEFLGTCRQAPRLPSPQTEPVNSVAQLALKFS
jgi:hypothetical protein